MVIDLSRAKGISNPPVLQSADLDEAPPPAYDAIVAGPSQLEPNRSNETVEAVPSGAKPIEKIFLYHKYIDLKGTYHITPGPEGSGFKWKGCFFTSLRRTPTVLFANKRGNIDLFLSTGGDLGHPVKIDTHVESDSGSVQVTLTHIAKNTRINFKVKTKMGNILIFIPKDYEGAIRLIARFGKITVLSGLAEVTRTAKSTNSKTLLLMGSNQTSNTADYCDIYSRYGSVVVGLTGVDSFTIPPGFWSKLGCKLLGIDSGKDKELEAEDPKPEGEESPITPFPLDKDVL